MASTTVLRKSGIKVLEPLYKIANDPRSWVRILVGAQKKISNPVISNKSIAMPPLAS